MYSIGERLPISTKYISNVGHSFNHYDILTLAPLSSLNSISNTRKGTMTNADPQADNIQCLFFRSYAGNDIMRCHIQ